MKTKIYDSKNIPLQTGEGRSCSRGTRRTNSGEGANRNAFTLAEVLITLGVIGVVAAVTMPTLLTNIQDRVRNEQVRTVKYKLTKATDKMKSLGKIGPYDEPATKNFVDELKKHMTIAKVCDSGHLSECWPSDTVNIHTALNTLESKPISSLTTGKGLKALALSSGGEDTVGIVTGDGVPMLLVYSPKCQALDEVKTYTWSVEDGKPVTNATTNCISAIFDINGAKGPNRVGQDIRTLNSLFGSIDLGAVSVSKSECEAMIKNSKYDVKECYYDTDYWAGGVKKCADMGLHLPDMQTLANIANSRYGTTLIGPYTLYVGTQYGEDCRTQIADWYGQNSYIFNEAEILCNVDTSTDANSALNNAEGSSTISGGYWSSLESSATNAYNRNFYTDNSSWTRSYARDNSTVRALCVGD